jgi:hypothetical protein
MTEGARQARGLEKPTDSSWVGEDKKTRATLATAALHRGYIFFKFTETDVSTFL